jgi:hypothetical protein
MSQDTLKQYNVGGLVVSARSIEQAKRAATAIKLSAQRPILNGSKR